MKREIDLISYLFHTEMKILSLLLSSIRRQKKNAASVLSISFIFILFFAGRGITEAHLAVPFLRGGYSSYSVPAARPMGMGAQPVGKLYGLTSLKRTLTNISDKIKRTKPIEADGSQHLDEVLRAFQNVLNGNDIDTSQLLKACRAHLKLMKSGGASLRLVAKDLESNLLKAETPFMKAPKQGKTLYSLLESERHSGIHEEGNLLANESAAMGLLWIRRSLAFQLDLFESSLVSEKGKDPDQEGPHPRDAAYEAYAKHLSPFHGWALRKVFPASLSQMPDREAFIAKFGEVSLEELTDEYDREIVNKLKSLVAAWDPLISSWEKDFERLDLEDMRKV
ncbi:hypothetical protein ACHAWT_004213 [Skeletonema menzelii]